MAKMPLWALNTWSTEEIKYVINESIEKLELFLAHNLSELVLYLAGPLAVFIYLVTVNAVLGLVSIIPLFIVAIIMIVMFKRFSHFMTELNTSSGDLSSSINEYVNGMRLIKAFHMGSSSFKKYAAAIEQQNSLWVRIARATGPLYAVYVVLLECGVLLLVPLSGYMFIQGKITASILMLFAFVGSRYLTDVRPLQEIANNLSFSMNGVKQVKEILDTPIFSKGKPFPNIHDIEVKDVSFAYEKDRLALKTVILISHTVSEWHLWESLEVVNQRLCNSFHVSMM